MYTIFNKESGEYEPAFLNQIEEFGALEYDKDAILALLEPSLFYAEDTDRISKDLNTPGSILFRHYQHGQRNVTYRDKMMLESSVSYRMRKQLEQKINDFYGL